MDGGWDSGADAVDAPQPVISRRSNAPNHAPSHLVVMDTATVQLLAGR
jgi:hypothetical protein